MPGNILRADTSFPQLDSSRSTEEKIDQISDYLYMLLEQLRYTLGNLGEDNFNQTELENIANIITEPIYVQLKDEEGHIAALQLTAEGLGSRIESAEGNISTLTQTAESLTSRISSAEGNVSALQQTAESLTSRISSTEGNVSTLQQTINGLTLSVTNGTDSSTIKLLASGTAISSQVISFTGMVTFTDLSGEGSSIINGSNITTGTISAISISGCNISGSTFKSMLEGDGTTSGEIQMYYLYIRDSFLAGGMKLDDAGEGTATENRYRMIVYTNTVAGVGFALKLMSAGGLSVEATKNVYISGGTAVTISSGEINIGTTTSKIYLKGTVYYNGTELSQL